MSVPTWKRNQSPMQYLDTARELEKYTIETCLKFPKRYTFFISQHLVKLSQDVYDNAKKANTIDPKNNRAMQELRLSYFAEAICSVQALSSQIDLAKECIKFFITSNDPRKQKTKKIESSTWQQWMDLIESEFQLLKGVYNTFVKKYSGDADV